MDIEISGRRLWFLSLVASLGGFLYGYDTAVIAGGEQQIQSGWGLSPFVHGLVMSSALWGTVIHLFWAIFVVPETKGQVLEDIKV